MDSGQRDQTRLSLYEREVNCNTVSSDRGGHIQRRNSRATTKTLSAMNTALMEVWIQHEKRSASPGRTRNDGDDRFKDRLVESSNETLSASCLSHSFCEKGSPVANLRTSFMPNYSASYRIPRSNLPEGTLQSIPPGSHEIEETTATFDATSRPTRLQSSDIHHAQPSDRIHSSASSNRCWYEPQTPLLQTKHLHLRPSINSSSQPAELPPSERHHLHWTSDWLITASQKEKLRPPFDYLPTQDGLRSSPADWKSSHTPASASATERALLEAQRHLWRSWPEAFWPELEVDKIRTSTSAGSRHQHHLRPGSRLPYPITCPTRTHSIRCVQHPFHEPPKLPPSYPLNHYTSPNRLIKAALISSVSRRRGLPVLAPPAYIYSRTNNPHFNIFGGILLYPELCFALAANLPVRDLLSLYAISKDFHTIIDTRLATVIMKQGQRKCPESSKTFPFRCYRALCRPDPSPRISHPHPLKHAAGEIRLVPSFRWLKMVLFRDKVCREIMIMMAEDGVPLPRRCELALKKMWFLMDLPDNARRIGFVHAQRLMTDLDLYFIMCFIVKLDLRFNDPVASNRHHGLRKLLLSQNGLLPLWRALKRTSLGTHYDVLKMWVATRHKPLPDEQGLPIFGLSPTEVGNQKMEYWGKRSKHETGKACTILLRPDQLVMREIFRRRMVFSKHFLRCLLWGYVNVVTLDNYPPRSWDDGRDALAYEDDEDERAIYDLDAGGGSNGGVRDDLLDLRLQKPISMLVQPRTSKDHSAEKKRKEDAFLARCMDWWRSESSGETLN